MNLAFGTRMNKRGGLCMAIGAVLVAVGLGLWARSVATTPDLALSKASDGGLYQVDFAPKSLPFHREVFHRWIVTLRTRTGVPVEHARLTFGGGMPGHGHGLPTQPQQTGGGARGSSASGAEDI
ncbi:MAG: hypothetical protein R3F21_07565 [Myxococcota bacterium]